MEYLKILYETIGLNPQYVPAILQYAETLAADPEWRTIIDAFNKDPHDDTLPNSAIERAQQFDIHPSTGSLLFVSFAHEHLRSVYQEKGIPEEFYWDAAKDLCWKFNECLMVDGVPGVQRYGWFMPYFRFERYACGRLQYDPNAYDKSDIYVYGDYTLHAGDFALKCHIPSGSPLTKESRMDSYRKAYNFFRGRYHSGILPIYTKSWLLYDKHFEILPPDSNIISFMREFDLRSSQAEEKGFGNAWRVFGADASKPPQEWPRKSAMQRAYADLICSGGTGGSGFGILLFDGEKILTEK